MHVVIPYLCLPVLLQEVLGHVGREDVVQELVGVTAHLGHLFKLSPFSVNKREKELKEEGGKLGFQDPALLHGRDASRSERVSLSLVCSVPYLACCFQRKSREDAISTCLP